MECIASESQSSDETKNSFSEQIILVCGGCGYIGSHAVLDLFRKGYQVIVLDDNSTSKADVLICIEQQLIKENIKCKNFGIKFYKGKIQDGALLDKIFTENKVDYVMHFCAYSLVGESMKNPLKYYDNNFSGTLYLVKSMIKHKVNKLIFSSTAAVYGEPAEMPITEDFVCHPTNTYGSSKLAVEQMLHFTSLAHKQFKYVIFRYFNAAGNDPSGCIGEDHCPETHLIPIILQTASGERKSISIFGTNYKTRDGTCIRDYIHVNDIVHAHKLGVDFLSNNKNKSNIFNLGSGSGFTVREVIEATKKVTKVNFTVVEGKAREGDPPQLIASNKKARSTLGWNRKYNKLEDIIKTAWDRVKLLKEQAEIETLEKVIDSE